MLAQTGFWPPDVPFTTRDLATVIQVMNESQN